MIDPNTGRPFKPGFINIFTPIAKLLAARDISRARRAARSQDWSAAATCYKDALRRDPKSGRAWLQLGHVLGQGGNASAARIAYENATRAEPAFALGHKHLGIVLVGTADQEEGIRSLAAASMLAPGDTEIRELLLVHGGGQVMEERLAEAAFDSISNRRSPNFIGLRATLLRKAARRAARDGQWRVAEALYRKVLKLRPNDAFAMLQLGHALNEQQHIAEAERILREAIAADPVLSDAWLHLGYVLVAQGKHDQAAEVFSVVNRLAPSKRKAHPFVKSRQAAVIAPTDTGSGSRDRLVLPDGLDPRERAIWLALAGRHNGEGDL